MLVLALVFGFLWCARVDAQIAWRVESPIPGPVDGLPVQFGLAFAPGRIQRISELRVLDSRNVPVVVEWTPLVRWADQSVHWARGRMTMTVGRKQPLRLHLVEKKHAVRAPGSRDLLQVHQDEKEIEVVNLVGRTGWSLRAVFPRHEGNGLLGLALGDQACFSENQGPRLTWWDDAGAARFGSKKATRLGSCSRVCATLWTDGFVEEEATYRWRTRFWAGSPLIGLEAVVQGWPGDARSGGITFQLSGPLREIAYRSGRTRRIRRQKARRLEAVFSPQGSARWDVDGRPWTREEPPDLPVAFGFGRRWLIAAPVDPARRGGLRLRVADRSVEIVFRRDMDDWSMDRRNRFQLVLAGMDGPPRVATWNAVVALANHGGGLMVPACGLFQQGGLGPIPSGQPGEDPAGTVFGRTLELFLRELDRVEYRTPDDLGDYQVPGIGWANGEYDVILALMRAFWWTRDPRIWCWTRRVVRHQLDVDLDWQHTGLPRMHGPRHDGGVELGHTWVRGLLAYALASGDEEAVEAARGVVQGIVSYLRGTRGGLRKERDYGWTLLALTTAAELFGEKEVATYRDRVAEALRVHIHERGLALVEGTRNPGVARTTTFTGLGLLVPALVEYSRVCHRPRWRKEARQMAQRYVVEAWDPETEQMAWSLFVDAVSGRVTGRRGTVKGGDLIFLAAGLAAASDGPDGGWWRRQAEGFLARGLARFRRDGFGSHNGDRVRVLHAIYELAATR
jgi:hypothetical protein